MTQIRVVPFGNEFKSTHECTSIQQRLFDSIPRYALGETPENMENVEYRLVIIRRALEAGYEDTEIPEVIIDILADIRHLCDRLKIDFASVDKKAYEYYLEEK